MARKDNDMSEARRSFLARCGKYAVVTPPTVGLLLSAAKHNYAVASSGGWGGKGGKGGNGGNGGNGNWGNGGNGGNGNWGGHGGNDRH